MKLAEGGYSEDACFPGPCYARRVQPPGLSSHYEMRVAELSKLLTAVDQRSDGFSSRRGITVLFIIGIAIANMFLGWPVWGVAAMVALSLLFVVLVVMHAFVVSEKMLVGERVEYVKAGQARIAADGTEQETPKKKKVTDPYGKRFEEPNHENAGDLDLFGDHSLFKLVSRAETAIGEEALAKYLLKPADAATVRLRQDAAKELLLTPILLEDLAIFARRAESKGRKSEPLALWGEAPNELPVAGATDVPPQRKMLILVARVLVPTTIVLFLTRGLLTPIHSLLGWAYLVTFVAQLATLASLYGPISRMVTFVSSREDPLGKFRRVFALLESQKEFESPLLREHVGALKSGAAPASVEIAALERIMNFADLRHNAIVHMIVNALFLYDLWVAMALERWRVRAGKRTRVWLRALGACEALSSIATFAGENPEYAWPEVSDGDARLSAKDLGHPMIPRGKRVVNDADLSIERRALLITGSNMSGKSTYLRSLGLCAVMAGAGLPVCAKSASLSLMSTWTSMRIGDALDRGMSHFYAELVRLKAIVTAAQSGNKVLFLLDEILHGTNSHERSIGARGVVQDLIMRGAIGGVSTHDFALVRIADESNGLVSKVHFSDRIEGGLMVFDYKLKPGVVESTNAIRLMKVIGIDVDYEVDEPAGGARADLN